MLTPKEIQEATFVKAVFGGYDMKSVDDFLDKLSADYVALYKENASLKSKLRVLVEKLEEYRKKEESLNQASVQAAAIVADAERKASQLLAQQPASPDAAQQAAQQAAQEAAQQAAQQAMRQALAGEIAAEEKRLESARLVASNFIHVVETTVSKHLKLLDELRTMDMAETKHARPYDYESEADDTAPPAEPAAEPAPEQPSETADSRPNIRSGAFAKRLEDLQFGANYNPKA